MKADSATSFNWKAKFDSAQTARVLGFDADFGRSGWMLPGNNSAQRRRMRSDTRWELEID
jgi:hypothetical protein